MNKNDLRTIQTSLDCRLWLDMPRRLEDLRIRVTTVRAGSAWQPHIMLARLERWRGNVYSTQYFTSAEDLGRAL